ncbi:MAG: ImmA/IrrE family metallo-endopeptidase [Clostridia bacterium]|jgi:Zn-dependent peptidase ImmA (M78 family)|nr:ImmA/IrrE family metallo-endopeptidase [Clostridia bacterium]
MNTLDLYGIVDKEKINIEDFNWSSAKARIFEIDNKYYIALDNKQIDTSIEEKEILAEELGHYFCNALYYINSSKELKDKCELRAKKWAYSVLVPLQKLQEKITQGFNLYDLADYFNVDIKYMIDCLDFYAEKYGVLV